MELAVPVDQLAWRPGPFHRALAALPVRFPANPVTAQPTAAAVPAAVSEPVPATALTQPHGAPQATPAASATPSQPGHAAQRRRGGPLAAWWRGQ